MIQSLQHPTLNTFNWNNSDVFSPQIMQILTMTQIRIFAQDNTYGIYLDIGLYDALLPINCLS
jgi:hypothetical protein